MMVVKAIHQTIGAEEENITGRARHQTDLRFDELIGAPECFLQDVTARMITGFTFVDLAGAEEPADVGVVGSHLFDFSGASG